MKQETAYLQPQLVPAQEITELAAPNPELDATISRFYQNPVFALENIHDDALLERDPFSVLVTDHHQLPELDGTGRAFHSYTIYDIRNPNPRISLIADEDLTKLVFTTCDINSDQPLSKIAIQQNSKVLSCDYNQSDPRKAQLQRNLGITSESPIQTDQPDNSESTALISRQTAAVLVALGLAVSGCTGLPTTTSSGESQFAPTPTAYVLPAEAPQVILPKETQPEALQMATPEPQVTSTPRPDSTATPVPKIVVGETVINATDFALQAPEVQSELLSRMDQAQKETLVASLMGIISEQEDNGQDTLRAKISLLNSLFKLTNQNIWMIDVNDPNIPLVLELKDEWSDLDFRITPYSIENGVVYSILYCEDSDNPAFENGTIISNKNWFLERNQPFRLDYADFLGDYTVSVEQYDMMLEGARTMNQFLPPNSQYRTFHIDGSLNSLYPGAINDLVYSRVIVQPATFREVDFEGNTIPPEITAYLSTHEPAHTVYAGIVMNLYPHSPPENYQRYFENYYQLELTKGAPITELFREGAYFGYVHAGHPQESPSELFASTSSLFLTGDQENRFRNQRAFLANVATGSASGSFTPEQVEYIRTATQFVVNFYATHPNAQEGLFCPEIMAFINGVR